MIRQSLLMCDCHILVESLFPSALPPCPCLIMVQRNFLKKLYAMHGSHFDNVAMLTEFNQKNVIDSTS